MSTSEYHGMSLTLVSVAPTHETIRFLAYSFEGIVGIIFGARSEDPLFRDMGDGHV